MKWAWIFLLSYTLIFAQNYSLEFNNPWGVDSSIASYAITVDEVMLTPNFDANYDFTIEFWMKLDPEQFGDQSVNSIRKVIFNIGPLAFFYDFFADSSAELVCNYVVNQPYIPLNNSLHWNHIALIHSHAEKGGLYINGEKAEDGWYNEMDITGKLYLSRLENFLYQSPYHGIIDNFRIWWKALNYEELIGAMHNEITITDSSLVLSYNFNEETGGIVFDQSENAYDLQLSNTAFNTDIPKSVFINRELGNQYIITPSTLALSFFKLNVDSLRTELSTDGGNSFTIIPFNEIADSIYLQLPQTNSHECKLKVSSFNNLSIFDTTQLFKLYSIGDTLRVPSQFESIQAALNASDDFGVVLVDDGTYSENLFWPNKLGIQLIAQDNDKCIINGNNLSRVITYREMEDPYAPPTLLKNLILKGGADVVDGAGIWIKNHNLEINNCIIENNTVNRRGGGIYCENTTLDIIDSEISDNLSTGTGGDGYGAGIYAIGSKINFVNAKLNDNEITSFGGNGGGFYLANSEYSINNLLIKNNEAPSGGGAEIHSSTLLNCSELMVLNNKTRNFGGGIYITNSNAIMNAVFGGNSTTFIGGAIAFMDELEIKNCIFYNNSADENGGAIGSAFNSRLITVENSLFIKNSSLNGGAVYSQSDANSSAIFNQNTIIDDFGISNNDDKIEVVNGFSDIAYCNIITGGISVKSNNNVVDALNNYWGDPSGPSHPSQNISGQGSAVNVLVNVIPWLTEINDDAPSIPPQNLSVSNVSDVSANISWHSPLNNDITSYRIYYGSGIDDYQFIDFIDVGSDTNFVVDGLNPSTNYSVSVTNIDSDGNESWFSTIESFSTLVSSANDNELKYEFTLSQNYPNPFNPSSSINYGIAKRSLVELIVYDILGREISTLVDEVKQPGFYKVTFDGSSLSSGVYFYQLIANDFIDTKKMVLIK